MAFIMSMLVAAGLVMIVFHFWKYLRPGGEGSPEIWREVGWWAAKGIGVPVLAWTLINCGAFPGVPILLRGVAEARLGKGDWVWPLLAGMGAGALVISTYWSAWTLLWLTGRFYHLAEEKREYRNTTLFWLAVLAPFAIGILWLSSVWEAGMVLTLWLIPVLHLSRPVWHKKQLPPSYTRATALMKRGNYNQAEWEVIRELEKCENDFQGWMMLAELYAVHFQDVAAAAQTIYDVCSQPETNPSQICTAIYKLSEWHLKVGEDPDSARQVLEVICKKWPDTPLDRMARLRMKQIPATRQDLLKQREPQRIRLPALSDDGELRAPEPVSDKAEAAAAANGCVEKLNRDPNDVSAREELARVLTERLGKADAGIEQISLLLGMPDQPENKRAEWLSMIGAWHFRFRHDPEAGRRVLQQLIQEHPQSLQAFTAQRRLNLMEIEERMRRNRAGMGARVSG